MFIKQNIWIFGLLTIHKLFSIIAILKESHSCKASFYRISKWLILLQELLSKLQFSYLFLVKICEIRNDTNHITRVLLKLDILELTNNLFIPMRSHSAHVHEHFLVLVICKNVIIIQTLKVRSELLELIVSFYLQTFEQAFIDCSSVQTHNTHQLLLSPSGLALVSESVNELMLLFNYSWIVDLLHSHV